MGRHLDEMLRRMAEESQQPRRRGEPEWKHELPEGLVKPPRRPVSRPDGNPLHDTLAFTAVDVVLLRHRFHATQRQFARMFGISVETLRNWEQGKRRPRGPSRALLRVARANPDAVARTLWRYRRVWWMD
jgi:putative transcriptional regulator